jgi:outer membrane lipoprotein-sorting protein
MQEKDKFLKKISYILLVIFFLIPHKLVAQKVEISELFNYNKSLKNSSIQFIQTDGQTVEEGIVYIGNNRIKIDYEKPQRLTIVLSKNKGMYINHNLKEAQFFNTNKSFIKIFFSIFTMGDFIDTANIDIFSDEIIIKNEFEINDNFYKTEIIYENEPIKIRKIKILENEKNLEMGFFNHNDLDVFTKNFFALLNPYIN